MRRLWPIVLLAVAGQMSAAEVYRSFDENGNPVFTDQPSEDAEKIELKDIPTIPALESRPQTASRNKPKPMERYRELSLTSPRNEGTYFRGEGPLPVTIQLEPRLSGGDTVAVYLDGVEILNGKNIIYSLPELDRGTHRLSVSIKDAEGNILKSSDTVTFFMRQASRQHPPSTVGPGG